MKKIFTLIAAALMTIGANAQGTYKVGAGTPKDGDKVIEVSNITMTYGGAEWKENKEATYMGAYGFSHITDAQSNGRVSNGIPSEGTNFKFEPAQDGTLQVAVVINGGKDFYVTDANGADVEYTTDLKIDEDAAKNNPGKELEWDGRKLNLKAFGLVTLDVKAGGTYYLFCTGSKLQLAGFIYTTGDATDVPQILTEVEPGVFAVTMKYADIETAFNAEWIANAWKMGAKIPAGTVMGENDDVTLVAGAGGVPVYVSDCGQNVSGNKFSDIKKVNETYNGYINAGSKLPQNNWKPGSYDEEYGEDYTPNIYIEDFEAEADFAQSNHGFVVVTPKKDGTLAFGVCVGDNSRSIGIWELGKGLIAYANFRNGDPDKTDNDGNPAPENEVCSFHGTTHDKNAPEYVDAKVEAGKTYLLLAGANKNVNMHQISFIAETSDNPDGISSVVAEGAAKSNVMYNLAGQRIVAPVSGQIYIQNGKKYIAK